MTSRFDHLYQFESPPWEIQRPQTCVQNAFRGGDIEGPVLDLGCGTGHNTVWMAEQGLVATGIDVSAVAIQRARALASQAQANVTFDVADARSYVSKEKFQTIVDSAVFHIFDDEDQSRYLHAAKNALVAGGRLVGFGFSDEEPGDWGPRRLSKSQLELCFADGWDLVSLDKVAYEIVRDEPVKAWRWIATRQPA